MKMVRFLKPYSFIAKDTIVVHYSLILRFNHGFLFVDEQTFQSLGTCIKLMYKVHMYMRLFLALICMYMYILIKYSGVTSSSITQFQSHFEFFKKLTLNS